MKTLFLDFCSHQKTIALVEADQTLALQQIEDHTDESTIMPLIEDMLMQQRNTPQRKIRSSAANHYSLTTNHSPETTNCFQKLSRITATTGPGGFMSQRVGLSIANALSWSLHIPIGGLHLSDLYAARVSGDALWVHSTKKQLLFIRGFGKYAALWPEPVTITLDELKTIAEGVYVGEVLPEQAAVLQINPLADMKAVSDVLPNLLDSISYEKKPLVPWYGRGA